MTVWKYVVLTFPLLVSACNENKPERRPVNKPAPAADKGGTNSTAATTAQHLHSPPAGAKFISSCTYKFTANPSNTSGSGVPSSEEIKAGEVANRLMSQGRLRICNELHLGGDISDETKVLHLEDQSAVCDLNARNAGSTSKVFSISEPCAAPTTGLQGMSLSSGTSSSSQVYTNYHRTTFYFDNLTAEEKSNVAKYVVPSMQKSTQGSSGSSSMDATPSLK